MNLSHRVRRIVALCAAAATVVSVASKTSQAGPAYQAYKACLANCIRTTAPWTWARAACGADCLADYLDSKLGGQRPGGGSTGQPAYNPPVGAGLTLLSSWGQGEGVTCSNFDPGYPYYDTYPTCYSAGVPEFTVEIVAAEGFDVPVSVDVLAMTDADSDFRPVGTATRVSNPVDHYEWTAQNNEDTIYLFIARYSMDPNEDVDHAMGFYASPYELAGSTPTEIKTWGRIKTMYK